MKNVEDIFPLSPMQSAMLLHARTATEDTLYSQFCYELHGAIDLDRLTAAWRAVVARHPGLRTMFAWEGLPRPMQVVRKIAELEVQRLDWAGAGTDPALQDAALAAWSAEDRARGFELTRAPLMRLAFAERPGRASLMLWSSHHLVLDRWCIGTILREVSERYAVPAAHSPKARGFRDYVAWLQTQDVEAARAHWRMALAGCDGAARAVTSSESAPAPRSRVVDAAVVDVDAAGLQSVREAARRLEVTTGTLFQAAWALVLHRLRGQRDVVYGVTVSGRPAELPGVESIVGTFINNLPVKVGFDPALSVQEWLREQHRAQLRRAPHEFLSTTEIHEQSGLGAGEALFDSLVVSLAAVDEPEVDVTNTDALRMVPLDGGLATTLPLTLGIEDQPESCRLRMKIDAIRHPVPGETAASILEHLLSSLRALVDVPVERSLGSLEGVGASAMPAPTVTTERVTPGATKLDQPAKAKGREGEELELIEGLLLRECRDILSRDALTLDDSFFDEGGGDSLLAARLHLRVETLIGRAVPQLAMFEAKTIGGMARILAEGDWPLVAGLVRPLQPEGTRNPLFCISSPEVNSMGYVLLARHLDRDQPVHLVQSPPRTDRVLRMAPSEIPAFARDYLDAMREIQPSGPYRLLGMCGGGMIAYEMAKQLRSAGEGVEFVGVLNTFALHTLSKLYHLRRAERRMHYYGRRVGKMLNLGFGERMGEVRRVLRGKLQPSQPPALTKGGAAKNGAAKNGVAKNGAITNGAPKSGASSATPSPPDEGPTLASVTEEWLSVDWPHRAPAAPEYAGAITVFRTRRQSYFRIRDRQLGWGRLAESVQIVPLKTVKHIDVLREPHVVDTARALEECLAALDARPGVVDVR